MARPARVLPLAGGLVCLGVASGTLFVGSRLGWIAPVPLWGIGLALLIALSGSELAIRLGPADCSQPRLHLRVGLQLLTVSVPIYVTGWGATLAVAYIYVVADATQRFGRRAVRPLMVWTMAALACGELAIARGLAPSMIARPAVYGLALIGGLAMIVAIHLIGIAACERDAAQQELHRREQRFRSLVQCSSDLITIIADDSRITWASPSAPHMLGFTPEQLQGRSVYEMVHPEDLGQVRERFQELLLTPGESVRVELRLRHADGYWCHVESVGTNMVGDPSVDGIVANMRDIGERKAIEARLIDQALRDPLTYLPNRALFVDRLQQSLHRAARTGHALAVLFLDLDRFKVVNDSLGHDAGDRLLGAVARRLESCVRPQDTVARLGGDEFTVLLDGLSDVNGAIHVAERITTAFRRPFLLSGQEVFTGSSIGIAVHEHGSTSGVHLEERGEDLLRQADLAMYMAKERGRSRYELFDETMSGQLVQQLELETELRRALERDEFRVHYQPVVEARTGALAGFEALVRWEHAERGLVPPDEFIPLAEDTGLIVPIGRWVLQQACSDMQRWLVAHPAAGHLTVAVNLSARQLVDRDLMGEVNEALVTSGLEPRHLVLEITESVVMGDAVASLAMLSNLDSLGIGLAIDDFGTGYSSLGYLKRFPVKTVKLDKSFVDDLGHGSVDDLLIVETIVRLAHALGMRVVAEGVETEAQLADLHRTGCDMVQGFHFWRPLDAKDAGTLLAASVLEGQFGHLREQPHHVRA